MAADTPVMTLDRLAAFDRAWTERDLDALTDAFSDDGVYAASVGPEPGATYRGRAAIRDGTAAMLAHDGGACRHSGPAWTFGDRAAARWAFEEQGRRVEGIDLFEFDGDRIRLKDAYRKTIAGPA